MDLELPGTASGRTSTRVIVRGLSFTIDATTRFEIADQQVTADEFLAGTGTVVEIEARPASAGAPIAVEIEIDADADGDGDDDD